MLTKAEWVFAGFVASACLLFGLALVPPSGIFGVANACIRSDGEVVRCEEHRASYGAKCDVRLPKCYWETYHK